MIKYFWFGIGNDNTVDSLDSRQYLRNFYDNIFLLVYIERLVMHQKYHFVDLILIFIPAIKNTLLYLILIFIDHLFPISITRYENKMDNHYDVFCVPDDQQFISRTTHIEVERAVCDRAIRFLNPTKQFNYGIKKCQI